MCRKVCLISLITLINLIGRIGLTSPEEISRDYELKLKLKPKVIESRVYYQGRKKMNWQKEIENKWARSLHWMTSIVLEDTISMKKEELTAKLLKKNIDTRPIFPPMSTFPMFKKASNPIAEFVGKRGISLHSAFRLTKDEVDFVTESILQIIGEL